MLVTDGELVRRATELDPKKAPKAPILMLVTVDGMSRLANKLHPLKA